MDIEFDSAKDAINTAKHGISLAEAAHFEMDTARVRFDDCHDEDRWIAVGRIGARIRVLAFAARNGRIRPISLRPATPKEARRYEQST